MCRAYFPTVIDHVLQPLAASLKETDKRMVKLLTPDLLDQVVSLVPDCWLRDRAVYSDGDEHRKAYCAYFEDPLLKSPRHAVEETIGARALRL